MKLGLAAVGLLALAALSGCGLSIVGAACAGCTSFEAGDAGVDPDAAAVAEPRVTAAPTSPPDRLPDGGVLEQDETSAPAAPVVTPFEKRCTPGTCNTLICPADRPCRVACEGESACGRVTCPAGQPCSIDCATRSACAALVLNAGKVSRLCVRVHGTEADGDATTWASQVLCALPPEPTACAFECPSGWCNYMQSCRREYPQAQCALAACEL